MIMKLNVKLFALAREVYGEETVDVELSDPADVGQLRDRLAKKIPALAQLMPQLMFAVNSEYAIDENPLYEGDEVACIPPVSGG
jgi:molybdopterin synthase sulfur carrier subunit